MEKIKRISAKEQVLEAMRKAIFDGKFKENEEITQAEVADMLGVSRMPVREAFQVLDREGLIHIDNNRRVTVNGFSLHDTYDHYQIRSLLEGLAAQKACDHPKYFDKLQELYKQSLQAVENEDTALYVQLNDDFHHTIWQAAESNPLISQLSNLWDGLQPQLPQLVPKQMERSVKEHEMILQAIINQDKEKSKQHMENHIMRSADHFIKHFENNMIN
ncbi:GntR family transcriptional regulator [Oceanobacillus jeddahense]|uniref:GntR family transcriptional regulator n=1 Tax=Oceanobacillus jeddahense TaxID=1462527 RepID=A0ABY5JQ92_9BACI|nr:GntR family transcriptional regulator [Oceanobacillus jeddahense]UUI02466.1 GntR family transcriptional regulator [Oceanobacillus jeddahense]